MQLKELEAGFLIQTTLKVCLTAKIPSPWQIFQVVLVIRMKTQECFG